MTVGPAGIEPRLQGIRRPGGPLLELDDGFVRRAKMVIGNREERPEYMVFILIEDLNDMPVRLGTGQLENVRTGRQYLPRNFDRTTECKHSFLVPFIGLGTRQQCEGYEAGQ